jgi:F0F1-type ATP synthase membrane subunit c/vacuolar-type H+-ATPase subunit K
MHFLQKKGVFSLFLSLLLLLGFSSQSFAQQEVLGTASMGVAKIVQPKNKDVKDGNVLSVANGEVILSETPYDSQVIGVVSRDAAIIINTRSTAGIPVISDGTVYLLVSSKEGPIKKGDLITTSTIPGIAVKAVKSGYVLGTALEDYSNTDPKKSDKIAVNLSLHYFNSKSVLPGSLTDVLKFALLPTKDGPTPIFKYIIAGGVVIASFVLGFMSFGRTAAKGVEALGRNPAAGKIIHLGIIFNVGIVVVIVLAGLTVSFLILRL